MVKRGNKNVTTSTESASSGLRILHQWMNAGETTMGYAVKAHK